MGRLRNLSETFKAAAFSNFNNSTPSSSNAPAVVNTEQDLRGNDAVGKDTMPAAVRETSNNSIPQSTSSTTRLDRSASRPNSMIYTPPVMESGGDLQVEELVPVFSFLSSHANKLYQEGYFLKLNDLDTNGKPNIDRNWTECFAQLVGTVLSLWDAAALDAAGSDGEVPPTFVNLADASIKMIETLPTRNPDVQPLQNVLSISTAGKNRYLLHFNSLHSLTQWTAGIRLALFENASLQELYTGSLIAGKGKYLNNIRQIMERSKFRSEDWARVRFGAGTPWRRCWCVIEPPDEKEWQRATKSLKKRSAYEKPAYPKGDIKFFDTKKTKKAIPIATITDAYSVYAIYPQAKSLIDQSTLIKVEGRITIHSNPESKTEGFVFVMPEVHPAVSGFEIMLRWLFPAYDTFHLYGRPNRLIADTLDTRGLMFAMPKERRYGYLDIIDVAALIHTDGSDRWTEREWRKQMKEMTSRRMLNAAPSRPSGNLGSQRGLRHSTSSRNGVHYDDNESARSTPPSRQGHHANLSTDAVFAAPQRISTAPPIGPNPLSPNHHVRSASETVLATSPSKGRRTYKPSRLSMDHESPEDDEVAPVPPIHRQPYFHGKAGEVENIDSKNSSDSDLNVQRVRAKAEDISQDMMDNIPPAPVATPPDFQHQPGDRPQRQPDMRPELRREKSRMSNATLDQLIESNKNNSAEAAAVAAWRTTSRGEDQAPQRVNETSNNRGMPANVAATAMVADHRSRDTSVGLRPVPSRQGSDRSITRKPLPHSTSDQSVTRKPISNLAPSAPLMGQGSYEVTNRDQKSANNAGVSMPYTDPQNSNQFDSKETRARTGELKTVGNPALPEIKRFSALNFDMPPVDFGVTHSLMPGNKTPNSSRPSTAGGVVGRRSPLDGPTTPERRSPYGNRTPDSLTPEEKRSLFYDKDSSNAAHARASSHVWHPGSAAGRQSPGRALTPEEFVQHKFNASRGPPGYMPSRSVSAGKIEQSPPTPKKLQKKRDSRPNSRSSNLTDISANLSAKEQEHVARMTGGPLLNATNRSRTPDPSVGLIGAIESREQEKRNMKEGVSNQMVQAAIAQHQHHAQGLAPQQQYPNAFPQQQQQQGYGPQQASYNQMTPMYYGAATSQPQWQHPQPEQWYDAVQSPAHQQQHQQYQQRFGGFYQ